MGNQCQRILFVTTDHEDNGEAGAALRDAGKPFITMVCSPDIIYDVPFVRETDGAWRFGLEGIRRLAVPRDPMSGARRRTDDNLRGVFA